MRCELRALDYCHSTNKYWSKKLNHNELRVRLHSLRVSIHGRGWSGWRVVYVIIRFSRFGGYSSIMWGSAVDGATATVDQHGWRRYRAHVWPFGVGGEKELDPEGKMMGTAQQNKGWWAWSGVSVQPDKNICRVTNVTRNRCHILPRRAGHSSTLARTLTTPTHKFVQI